MDPQVSGDPDRRSGKIKRPPCQEAKKRGVSVENRLKPDSEKVKHFLSLLWFGAKSGMISLVEISGGQVHPLCGDVRCVRGLLTEFSKQAATADLYHTIGLLRDHPKRGRGTEADVIAIPGFWFDLDCRGGKHNTKDLPSKEDALAFIQSLSLRPSLVVWSGGGLHIYWLFHAPIYFHTLEEREAVKDLSSRFQKGIILRGQEQGWRLDNTSDLVRLLRLPGTFNHKRGAVAVEILEESDLRYEPTDLDTGNKRPSETKDQRSSTQASGGLESLRLSIAVKKLIREGVPPGERSEATISVITSLLKAGADDDLIIRIFEDHPQGIGAKYHEKRSGREKWIRDEIRRAKVKFSSEPEGLDSEERDWRGWPVLHPEALCGFAGRFVELASRKSEADPAAILITFLSRFGVECGGPFLYIGDSKHSPRINSVVVGSTSKSRKGTSSKPVERLFKLEHISEADPYVPARFSPGPLSSGEGLIYAVRDPVEAWKDNGDGGLMVVIDPGVTDKRLFVLDEEFGSALIATRRDGNTLSTIVRNMWDTGDLEPLTKSNRIKATGAHIAFVSHITLVELNRRLDETEFFSGFANRILWCCARRQKLVAFPEPMPTQELASIQWDLRRILETAKGFGEMSLSADAKELWGKIYPELSKDQSGLVGAVTDRAEAQAVRLAMIYALLDQSGVIEPPHLQSALSVWSYCRESAEFIFSGREINQSSGKILNLLHEKGSMTTTAIYEAFCGHITKKQLEAALMELIAQKKVTLDNDDQTGGRPRSVFSVCSI